MYVQELEAEGQYSQAEHHYVEAHDWKAAINMFRNNDHWEDAYRVSLFQIEQILGSIR